MNIGMESNYQESICELSEKKKEEISDLIQTIDESGVDEEHKIILEQNQFYFHEFTKLSEANIILRNQLKNLLEEKNSLKNQIQKLENKCKASNKTVVINDTYTNRKRHRRTKKEISREYVCNFIGCKKSYGSEGSLNQHTKIKHSNKV